MTNLATEQMANDELQVAYSYCLSHLAHLGDRTALRFKKAFPTYDSWHHVPLSGRDEAARNALGRDSSQFLATNFDAILDRAISDVKAHERQGIRVVSIDSERYPFLLKQIDDAPLVLFVKGLIEALSEGLNVAVVGTRDTTQNGEKVASRVAKWFGEQGWCVVSGLAKGIDTAAHRGILDIGGKTAAVMATPLNKVYPAENRLLAGEILEKGGCWISELPVWGKFHRSSFVQRDRIQSGLSVAVIPVQTDIEGGTMHTVRFAEQQGRLLMCPRPIESEQTSKQYAGVRLLIDSKRAIPFSNTDFPKVLESLILGRAALLKGAGLSTNARGVTGESPITGEGPTPEELAAPPLLAETPHVQMNDESDSKPQRKKKQSKLERLQSNFGFVADDVPTMPRRKVGKREKEIEIRLLEQLTTELYDAKRPDGGAISDRTDFKRWLEEKIKVLKQ